MSSPHEMKRPAAKASATSSATSLELDIRLRAYELYQQRGGEEGHEIEDWLRAEEEVRQNMGNRKAA